MIIKRFKLIGNITPGNNCFGAFLVYKIPYFAVKCFPVLP